MSIEVPAPVAFCVFSPLVGNGSDGTYFTDHNQVSALVPSRLTEVNIRVGTSLVGAQAKARSLLGVQAKIATKSAGEVLLRYHGGGIAWTGMDATNAAGTWTVHTLRVGSADVLTEVSGYLYDVPGVDADGDMISHQVITGLTFTTRGGTTLTDLQGQSVFGEVPRGAVPFCLRLKDKSPIVGFYGSARRILQTDPTYERIVGNEKTADTGIVCALGAIFDTGLRYVSNGDYTIQDRKHGGHLCLDDKGSLRVSDSVNSQFRLRAGADVWTVKHVDDVHFTLQHKSTGKYLLVTGIMKDFVPFPRSCTVGALASQNLTDPTTDYFNAHWRVEFSRDPGGDQDYVNILQEGGQMGVVAANGYDGLTYFQPPFSRRNAEWKFVPFP